MNRDLVTRVLNSPKLKNISIISILHVLMVVLEELANEDRL